MKRDVSLDIMRGLAILSMVEIHSLLHFRPENQFIYLVMRSLGTLAAPFFLISAGMGVAYLSDKYIEKINVFRQILVKRGFFLIIFASALGLFYLDLSRIFDWDIFTFIGFMYLIIAMIGRNKYLILIFTFVSIILNLILPVDYPIILRAGSFPIIPFASFFLIGIIIKGLKPILERPKIQIIALFISLVIFIWVIISYSKDIINFSRYDVWSFRGTLGIVSLYFFILSIIRAVINKTPKILTFFKPLLKIGNLSFSVYYIQYFLLIISPKILQLIFKCPEVILINSFFWGILLLIIFFLLYIIVLVWERFNFIFSLEWFMNRYITTRSSFSQNR